MKKNSQPPPRDQIIASLRACAASVAETATTLAAQVAADKFSFESEFSIVCGESLGAVLAVPPPTPGQDVSLLPLGDLQRVIAQRSPSPCAIPPVSSSKAKRPLWTVAIPACDPNPEYFSVLIGGVIKALSKTESWEIVIVDGSLNKGGLASIAGLVSKHPIGIFPLPAGAGPIVARNECIRLARGEFVHILQQEDFVSDHFYAHLGEALQAQPESGLAACINGFFDSRGHTRAFRCTHETSGFYRDAKFAVAWAYRLPLSTLVVRRALYEALGGFHEDLGLWAEWEMRARLFAASPLCFLQEAMVLVRLHAASWRQTEMRAARNLQICPRAISLAIRCYPESVANDFGSISVDLFAREFAHFGCCLLTANLLREGMLHFEAAKRLSPNQNILEIAKKRNFHVLKSQVAETAALPALLPEAVQQKPSPTDNDFFPPDELKDLESLVAAYRANPADGNAFEQARALRNALCGYLLNAEVAALGNLFAGNFRKVFALLRESGVSAEKDGADESQLKQLATQMLAANPADLRGLLATMLLCPAHLASLSTEFIAKPDWFMGLYMDYLLASPEGFVQIGEADRYFDHVTALLAAIERDIAETPLAPTAKWAAFQIARRLNLIPVYFSQRAVQDLMRARARVLAFLLQQTGRQLEATFPPRPFHRKKIRVGFLSAHLGPQTETYTSVPSFYVDREKFEIHLFVLGNNPSAIETHSRNVADSFNVLPADFAARVETLRGAGLDVLVIGTNMTAVTNDITLLGMHRLAPIQIASSSSPMSPGLPHIDGFLSGIVHGYDAYTGQYNERLLLFDGAISCLEYSVDRPQTKTVFNRQKFGIPDGVPLFVSGANFFKILPELQATWAKILQQVPGSYLLLHPFNRNWSSRYPIARFRRDLDRVFEQAGVDAARVVISEESLPSRAEVCQLMALGDVYLDSFPFSGSVSLVDPLEAGVPPVAWCAPSTRGLMAASMLSDLNLRELVAESEDAYVASAVRLATDPQERARISGKVRAAMAAGPRFFDVQKYGREVSRVLEEIVLAERETEKAPTGKEILRRAETALSSGRLGEVEDLCRYVLEREPTTAKGWALLAEVARRCGDLSYASDLADQAVELEPNRADFWSALGEIRREKMDPAGAMEAYRRALELSPTSPIAWFGKAVVHDECKESAEAEHSYIQALLQSKDRVETARFRVQFSGFLKAQKRMKEAIKQMHQAASAAPDSCETLLLLGTFLRESGAIAEAASAFSRVAQKFPVSGRSWLEWGKTLLLLGRPGEAVEKMRKAVACQPEDPDVLFNLGYALQQNGQRKEALQAYRSAEQAGCASEALHANIGELLKE